MKFWRQTITGGLVILMAVSLASESVAAKQKVFMCCETYSLRSLMGSKYDYVTVMPVMKSLGMKGVALNDIWLKSCDKPYLDEIKKAAKDNGIKIVGLICGGSLVSDNEEARRKQIEENKTSLRAAGYLGAKIVRFDLGGFGDDAKDGTVGVERAIAAFKELLPIAKECKVKLTMENHGGVSKKADWIIAVIKGTDPKWIGSCLDFKNWPADVLYAENAKLAPYAYHVHAKALAFDANGEETSVSYQKLLQLLKDAKYKGAVSIEYEGHEDPIQGVKKTRDLILKYWKM